MSDKSMKYYGKPRARYMAKLDGIFEAVEVDSFYLRKLLYQTISMIEKATGDPELSFGYVIERKTFSGEAGEVTEDSDIILDSESLKKYEDDVVMAIIAHELAHYHLEHYDGSRTDFLAMEHEADDMARKWGFDVDKFRRICGEPTCSICPGDSLGD